MLVALRVVDGAATGLWVVPAIVALLFHDVAAALVWLVFDHAITAAASAAGVASRRWAARVLWVLYFAVATWAAINVPIARVFSTPLTWPMLAAAGGAIADSIGVQVTAANALALLVVLAVAVVAPRLLARVGRPGRVCVAVLAAVCVAWLLAGSWAVARVPTLGLHRNAIGALASSLADRWRARLAGRRGGAREPSSEPALAVEGSALDLNRLAGAAAGRNVIWVNLESTAAQYLPAWGAARDPMPRLGALARDAWIFDNVYTAHPESIKGLFAMLCSTAPAAHSGAARYTEAALPCDPLPARLRAAGYHTALFHSGWFAYLGMRGIVEGRGFDRLADAGDIGGTWKRSFGVDEPATVARALAWVDEQPRGEPFFLMYLPIAGHHPYNSPGPADDPHPFGHASDFDEYSNDLYRGDRALGRLVDGIRERGLDDKTLWIFVGDHGEAFHQHEGNFAHTLFLYEENVHVPLVVRAPGLGDAGLRVPQIASTLDVAPTVLALLGLGPPPRRWQGRSLLAADRGVARFYVDQVTWQVGLRSGPWKYLLDMESGRSELYRLDEDSQERRNLALVEEERVRRYRENVAAWAVRQRALVAGGGGR